MEEYPSIIYQQQIKPQFPELEHLKCPRCDSDNTKFCYYNNYNLSQPRHFCKNCKRYWTKGGSLRNIPVGGGSRKITNRSSKPKQPSSPAPAITPASSKPEPTRICGPSSVDFPGNFSSLLGSNGGFGDLMERLNRNGSTIVQLGGFSENPNSSLGSSKMMIRNSATELQSDNSSETFLGVQSGGGGGGGGGGNGWPELAIYTPGSSLRQKTI